MALASLCSGLKSPIPKGGNFLEIGILGTDGFSLAMIKFLFKKERTTYNFPYEKENKTEFENTVKPEILSLVSFLLEDVKKDYKWQ